MSLNQIFQAIRDGIAGFFAGIWNYPINWGLILAVMIAAGSIAIGLALMFLMARELFRGLGAVLSRLFSRLSRPQ